VSSHRGRLRVALGCGVLALGIAGVAGVVGCRPSDRTGAPRHTETTSSAGSQRYPLTGRVLSVDVQRHRAVIDHQAIPGLMAAMTMAYPVRDAGALQQLMPGQHITADVVVTADSLWLEHIVVLAKKP
jgi:Cu/Ag efflux protein CusF